MRDFFVDELVRLRHHCVKLSQGLNDCDLDDPHCQGQLQMLENALENYSRLVNLATEVQGVVDLRLALHRRYGAALMQHKRCLRRHRGGSAAHSDDYWATLGKMQYYSHLIRRLQALIAAASDEAIHAATDERPPHEVFQSDARRVETLHGIAASHNTALAQAYLISDYVNGWSSSASG